MQELYAFYDSIIGIFNIPEVKALSFFISVASLLISLWLFRRTLQLVASQRKHLVVDQSRFIDDMWQKSNALILSDDRFIEKIREMFGYRSTDEVIDTYMIFLTMNPLYVSYKSMKEGAMTPHIFEVTRDNVLSNYSGNHKTLIAMMRQRGYAQDFVDTCEEYLAALPVKSALPTTDPPMTDVASTEVKKSAP